MNLSPLTHPAEGPLLFLRLAPPALPSSPPVPRAPHQQVVQLDLDAQGHSQGLVEREPGAGDKDVVAWVTQDTDGQIYSLAAATGQDHILHGRGVGGREQGEDEGLSSFTRRESLLKD